MTSAYPKIKKAYKRRRQAVGEPTQAFHLDSRFWRQVVKELKAEAAFWLSEDLKAKGKLIFKDCLVSISAHRVSKYDIWASFVDTWAEKNDMRTDTSNAWTNKRALEVPLEWFERYAPDLTVVDEIELAIVKVLWRKRAWPESLPYDGRMVTRYFVSVDPHSSTNANQAGFVYFIRNKDIYKIGITVDLLRRMAELSPDEILNVVRCTNYFDVESAIHKKFSEARLPQSEYFRLNSEQIEKVHQMMLKLASI